MKKTTLKLVDDLTSFQPENIRLNKGWSPEEGDRLSWILEGPGGPSGERRVSCWFMPPQVSVGALGGEPDVPAANCLFITQEDVYECRVLVAHDE